MAQKLSTVLLLDPIEPSTVTELVAKRLLGLIASGALKPGDRLPPERELAQQLNVGRTTVREALKLLTLGGLLEARRGDGTYVRQEFTSLLSQQVQWPLLLHGDEIEMIFEVREALEVKTARLAAERATAEEIERIAVFRQLQAIAGRDIERETELDMVFHEAIAGAAHNMLLSRLMISLHDILRQYIALSNEMTDRLDTTMSEHAAIYEAIVARDADAAGQAMLDHLVLSRKWIVEGPARLRPSSS
jgi:GntR family transcriptional repressor for pyruvate dehydrogenase complex